MLAIVKLYELALEYYKQGTLLLSVDQKTCIQALERLVADKLVKPGHIKKIEHHYKRHGIRNLIGGFVVATGEVIGKCYSRNRNIEFARFLIQVFKKYKKFRRIEIIADNYATHTHLNTCLLVAQLCNIKVREEDLKTKKQRVEFLTSKNKGIVFHFLPTHASWLNQIEIWFRIITQKVIKRGNFTSTADLVEKITKYIEFDWNKKNAHPFQWTYKGKTCCA